MLKRLLVAVAAFLIASPALAASPPANQLPAIPGANGYVLATPAALIGYDSMTMAPCVVGKTATCLLAIAGTFSVDTSALATSVLQTAGNTSLSTIATDIGPPGATACATDTGSCAVNALLQRLAQRLTTINTTLGTPFQAGGSIANTTFAATQSGTWTVGLSGGNFQLSPSITVQNAAYSAGNSEGGLITMTGAARTNGGGGILDGLRLKSAGGSTNTVWVYGWSKTPVATCTDKTAYVTSASDAPYALAGFPVTGTFGNAPGSWDTATTVQFGPLSGLLANFKNQDSSPGTALYFCIVTAGSVTPAATADISMIAGGVQD